MEYKSYVQKAASGKKVLSVRAATAIVHDATRGYYYSTLGLGGGDWLRSALLPAARCLETTARSAGQRRLAAEAWHVTADVYIVLKAHWTAIATYHRAIRVDPLFVDAVREIAFVQEWFLEDHARAARNYRRAIRMAPDDEGLRIDLEFCLAKLANGH